MLVTRIFSFSQSVIDHFKDQFLDFDFPFGLAFFVLR